jgi:hypothetical protein
MNKRVTFVAIHGAMRAGKDEVGQSIIGYINHHAKEVIGSGFRQTHHAERIANADILKEVASTIFSIPRDKIFDDNFKNELVDVRDHDGKQLTWRGLLQYFGSEICRKMQPDCWVRAMIKETRRLHDSDVFVVTDCRFPNEIEVLRTAGDVIVVRVTRPGFEGDQHISENALNYWTDNDYMISNCRGLGELYRQSDDVASAILERIDR